MKALVPAPTGISPTTAAEQKQNKKNNQYSFHLVPLWLEEAVGSFEEEPRSFSIATMLRKAAANVCTDQDTIHRALSISVLLTFEATWTGNPQRCFRYSLLAAKCRHLQSS